jgi:mono/diheme cytochrome c family protein
MSKVTAQEWVVPNDQKSKEAPHPFTDETVKNGKAVFQQNCQVCHGEPTKGTYNKGLVPMPGDPATDKFQKQTNGALFYKITNGRGLMPQFKDVLTEEQRWQVISYFRSFNKNYVQTEAGVTQVATAVPNAILTISFLPQTYQIKVLVTDSSKKPIQGAEVTLLVKRYFGNMKIVDPVSTDQTGGALFNFPKDIPGDKTGKLTLIASLQTGGNEVKEIDTLAIGVPTDKPPLTAPRAMWNVMAKAPVWLLLSYFGVVFLIWGFLVYIVFQLVRIRNENKNLLTDKS